MGQFMQERGTGIAPTYVVPGSEPTQMAEFFRAAAHLHRAAPWKIAIDDPIGVTIEALGIRRAVISIVGYEQEELGFLRFRTIDDYDRFLHAAEDVQAGEKPDFPPHVALLFESGSAIDQAIRDEVAHHGWEIANEEAYPGVVAVDEDLIGRMPTPEELATMTAIAEVLATFVARDRRRAVRFFEGKDRKAVVETPLGEAVFEDTEVLDVETSEEAEPLEHFDPRLDMRDEYGDIDPHLHKRYQRTIVDRFAASPEAAALEETGWLGIFMDYLADYCGVTVATMTRANLRHVLFGLFPRKVSCDASEASDIVDELRAFLAFAKREYGLESAEACLRELAGDAAKKLERELSNPANFGMAKSFLMAGKDAGYDMTSREGVDAWTARVNERPFGPAALPPAPRASTTSSAGRAKKKKKKKLAQASKRKNR